MPYTFANYTLTALAGGAGGAGTSLGSGDTSLYLPTGAGAAYPSSGTFLVQLGTATGVHELVSATGRSGDHVTGLTRGVEGTSARNWPVGTALELVLTAAEIGSFINATAGQFPVSAYGAVGDGSTDDTTALQAAITAAQNAGGGTVIFANLTYKVSSPLAITAANVRLLGAGRWATVIRPSASFSGSAVITVTQANFCAVEHLAIAYAAGPSSSSPSASGILVTSSRNFRAQALDFQYLNGYCIEILGSSSLSPNASYGAMLSQIHEISCAGGLHFQGFSAGSWAVQAWATDINLEGIDGPLDAILFEDAFDVLIENLNGAVTQTPNSQSFLHVLGNCASIYLTNVDIGALGTMTAAELLVESGTNGTPKGVHINNGVIQRGTNNVLVNAGTELIFSNMTFSQAATSAISLQGSSGYIVFADCIFNNSNQTNTTAYDFVNNTTGRVLVHHSFFRTVVGSGAGKVTQTFSINAGNKLYLTNNYFDGLGGTPSNAFASGQAALVTRGNAQYNPVGAFTVSVPASGSTKTASYDSTVVINALNSLTAVAIGGTTVPGTPASGSSYRVAAGQTIALTYGGAAPTWQWFGD